MPDETGLTVHFNLHMDPSKGDISESNIIDVLTEEILSSNVTGSVLGDLVIDLDSLDIQERSQTSSLSSYDSKTTGFMFGDSSTSTYDHGTSSLIDRTSGNAVDGDKRICHRFAIEYCNQLPYNLTTFPNAMGHKGYEDAKYDIDRFR